MDAGGNRKDRQHHGVAQDHFSDGPKSVEKLAGKPVDLLFKSEFLFLHRCHFQPIRAGRALRLFDSMTEGSVLLFQFFKM